MKLKKLYIENFKNLKQFELNFEDKNGINVLIGNNGCGKSNVLESISSIFATLYKIDSKTKEISFEFEFELIYDISIPAMPLKTGEPISKLHTITTSSKEDKFIFESNKSIPIDNKGIVDFLPFQLIALYSGEEPRLWDSYYEPFYKKYKDDYINNLKPFEFPKQELLYINGYYWSIAFLTLACSFINTDDIAKNKIIKNINIKFNQQTIKYLYKKSPSLVTTFANIISEGQDEVNFTLEEFNDKAIDTDKILFQKLATAYLPKNPQEKLIDKITITFEDDTTIKSLSEGEKKRLLLKLITTVVAERNSLILFDEPDVFLHPKWQSELIDHLMEHKRDNTSILMTTHSPNILKNISSKNVFLLKKEAENINVHRPPSSLLGRDVNAILDETMGVSERNLEIEKLFEQYFHYISEKDFDKVQEIEDAILKLTEDEENFYRDEPQFTKAKAIIQRMKMFE